MYTFKLLDIVLQGFAFLTAFILLLTFDVFGYFYWIKVGIILWIILSAVLNLVVYRPLSTFRRIISLFLGSALLVFGVLYAAQVPIPKLNFYFQPFSFLIIIVYFVVSIRELNKLKEKGQIDLDF